MLSAVPTRILLYGTECFMCISCVYADSYLWSKMKEVRGGADEDAEKTEGGVGEGLKYCSNV